MPSGDAGRNGPQDVRRGEYKGGFSPEVEAWMLERSLAFQRATQGRNAPGRPLDGVTYAKSTRSR